MIKYIDRLPESVKISDDIVDTEEKFEGFSEYQSADTGRGKYYGTNHWKTHCQRNR